MPGKYSISDSLPDNRPQGTAAPLHQAPSVAYFHSLVNAEAGAFITYTLETWVQKSEVT